MSMAAGIATFEVHMRQKTHTMMVTPEITRRRLLQAVAASAVTTSTVASAQSSWPDRPVRVLVPFPAGGGADTVARIIFNSLREILGQPFVIENRGGAGGTIGEGVVARARADGYTILYDATNFSTNPSMYSNPGFDFAKDFEPVFLASLVPNMFVVTSSVPVKTVHDVIAFGKAAPGGLDFASTGIGSVQHLCLEMFRHMTGIKMNHVPYQGGAPALNDVIAGHIKFLFSNGAGALPHINAGRVNAVAHTGKGRLSTLPDLPAVAETLPGFEAYEWNGVFAPAGTSPAIIARLNEGLNAALMAPEVSSRLAQLNISYQKNTPEEFRAFVAAETQKWGGVIRQANVKLE